MLILQCENMGFVQWIESSQGTQMLDESHFALLFVIQCELFSHSTHF